MLIHFLSNYSIIGKVGNKIRISGEFPGITKDDFVFLNRDDDYLEEDPAYKIEDIEYNNQKIFKAVIVAE